jgi:hypothetical protein
LSCDWPGASGVLQREHRYSRCLVVSSSSFSVIISRSARLRLRAASIDLCVMTGRPSAVLHSLWRGAGVGESRVEKFLVMGGIAALNCDAGGVEEESEECVALLDTKVPFLVARLRSRSFRAASCSRFATSSFLARTTGSSPRGFRLLGLMFIVRMTGAAWIHQHISTCASGRASRGNGEGQCATYSSFHGGHDWIGGNQSKGWFREAHQRPSAHDFFNFVSLVA